MQHISHHRFLVEAPDLEKARSKVNRFLNSTSLIKYSVVRFNDSLSFSAEDESFWEELDKGIAENRGAVTGFCEELGSQGYKTIDDLRSMPQGFESKILHTLVHFLDGFIGVDSLLYNLVEDSHWVSPDLRQAIKQKPDQYCLIYLDGGEVVKTVPQDSPQ